MAVPAPECVLCRGEQGDAELNRVEVWRDDVWRLTISLESEVPGFAYLEPHRHIPHITDLDGAEAASLGPVLARTTSVLQAQTNAELVYIYVFGAGIPHLHLHLAPHRTGDALNTQLIRGEVEEERLPSGAGRITSREFPPLPEAELRAIAARVRKSLAD